VTPTPQSSLDRRALAKFVLAWGFLNLFINLDFPAAPILSLKLLRPSLEVWALLGVLCALAWFGIAGRARIYLPLVALLVFGRLFRLGDVIMPVYFNRPFNLYMDLGYLPGLAHLLANSFSLTRLACYAALTAILVAALLWGLWRSLQTAGAFFRYPAARHGFLGLSAVLALALGAYQSGHYPARLPPPATAFTPRLAEEMAFMANIREIRRRGLSAVQMAAARIPAYEAPLVRLQGRNVYLFLIESYGQTLFKKPAHWQAFAPSIRRFATTLAQEGYTIYSRYLRSPTFGGASWLAFGTLESGVWLSDQLRYAYLVASRVPPMASYFKQAGYRTLSIMPGTTMPWPEGRYFGYQQEYHARDLDYRGPAFGFAPMPDQFVLDRIYRREIAGHKGPLFIRYVLVSTHAPFHRQPVYLTDWELIGDGSVFHQLEPVAFPNNWPDLTEATEAYLTAIKYELTVLGHYLTRFAHDDALIIVLGDHQPNAHITGPDAPSLVPVHVISRQPATLAAFRQMGFTAGIIPSDRPPFGGMQDFLPDLLAAFSR
jgi:hypothetical protein